jgi:hypothetical protein
LVIKGNREQFLSGKLLNSIYNKTLNPIYEIKDDYFSLGMIILAIAAEKEAGDFYSWNDKGHGLLNMKKIEYCLKDVQKKYSSRLVKKIRALIFYTEI